MYFKNYYSDVFDFVFSQTHTDINMHVGSVEDAQPASQSSPQKYGLIRNF